MQKVYLDTLSSTSPAPAVVAAMRRIEAESFSNPGSLHGDALRARDAITLARNQVAKFISARPSDLLTFTSSGTEAINLAIKGLAWAHPHSGARILHTHGDHPSVTESVRWLATQGFKPHPIGISPQGRIDLEQLEAELTSDTLLVCVPAIQLDFGAIQSLEAIAAITRARGVPLLVDAQAAAGWTTIDVQSLGIDFLALSPHRFLGPKGVGVLVHNPRHPLTPLLHGGLQEEGRRGGTENVSAIVGAGVAAELAAKRLADPALQALIRDRQAYLWHGLAGKIENVTLLGPPPGPLRSPHHLAIAFEGVEAEGLVLLADLQGVACSSGPSCLGRATPIIPAFTAAGIPREVAASTVFFGLSSDLQPEELDSVIEILIKLVTKLRSM